MTHKLLLVEDHEMNREMLMRRLSKLGYLVVTAVDGGDAIDKAATEQPDLILMDMSLPVMDGYEATKVIRSQPETARIPIIAVTAFVHEFDRAKALEAGCDEYETKPVDMSALASKLKKLLGRAA